MKEERINEIMENITDDSSLCIIREALRQYGNEELTTNLKNDSVLEKYKDNVFSLEIDKFRNGNLNLMTVGSSPEVVLEFQNNEAIED